ncbi:SDR family oxidoreductase [Actinocrispum sp. NPDC049592]|uniref:SDR family oxidoreductase n=1 Tax=Actinocrispum sp. NPDC049592 TaxID=3154835 RepID=UPI003416CA27
MAKTILVTGGTGKLGSLVVGLLRADGHDVRVASRGTGPGLFTVDWKTGAGLDAAVAGVDAIVHCAAAFNDIAPDRALVAAAAKAQVPHLLYISIVGVDKIPFRYYATKRAAEELIERSGVPYTVLRTTQFHDLIRVLLAFLARSPLMFVPSLRFQPIDVSEVATRLAGLAAGSPAGHVEVMGGPQVRELTEMARVYLAATGRRRAIVPFRLPGKAFGRFRAGDHLAPDHAVGKITLEEHLASTKDTRKVAYR